MRRAAGRTHVAAAGIAVLAALGCKGDDARKNDGVVSTAAAHTLSSLRARPGLLLAAGPAARFETVAGGLVPRFALPSDASARLVLPAKSSSPIRLEDAGSGATIEFSLDGSRAIAAQAAEGYLVYPKAHASGATLLYRALGEGTEDFVSFETRPPVAEITYDVALGKNVAGLRLVAGALEMLDAGGAPRLRVAPPYIVGADGARTDAVLAVKGCAVDTNPAAPWGRRVTPPGAGRCAVRVSWDDDVVVYPAVLDPRWTTTMNTMTAARQDHTATLITATGSAAGKVLVTGGRANGTTTTALDTAELFDPATNTWAGTTAMGSGNARWSHSGTQLNTSSNATTSGKVLIAGGINGTTSISTARLYNPADGTWAAAGSLSAGRHLHTATLIPSSGNVVVIGGLNNTTVLDTAAVYNPATMAGSWTNVVPVMASRRRFHTATLLTSSNANFDNRILVSGGNSGGTTSVSGVQLFNVAGSTWTATTALPAAREGHTATRLTNGNVLITGGKTGTGPSLASALVFTIPASGTAATWPATGSMAAGRVAHTATLLPTGVVVNGQVLVAGGLTTGTSPIATAQYWNGSTWSNAPTMTTAVMGHTATTLASGMVLIAGGSNGSAAVNTARVFETFFCTTGTDCASGFCVAGVCCNIACTGECQACNLSGSLGTCTPKPNGTACTADTNPCTLDQCNGSSTTCQHPAGNNGAACPDDGNPCTTDTCNGSSTTCQHPAGNNGAVCPNDGNPCTTDTCNGSSTTCQHPAGNNGATCSDGNACTQTDTCSNGTCAGSNPVVCTASDQCHDVGVCNTGTGVCSNPNKANGSGCNDSNACTQSDTCQAGVCTGSNPVVCTASDQCHDVGACNTGTGACSNPNKANGTGCNDSNACTQSDACQAGVCTGSNPVVCTASDQCHDVGVCNTGTGVCSNPNKANGTGCNDSNACTQSDTCQAGVCTGSNPVVCTASDQCHVAGTCAPGTGVCSNPNAANGAACSDNDLCTQSDSCQSGVCAGTNPVVCAAQDQCHVVGTCNPANGACSAPRVTDGTGCSDGNHCSSGDSCQAGTCLPGSVNVCFGTGQPNYISVIDLGSTQGFSNATSINNSGVVVGQDVPPAAGVYQNGYPGSRGFRWSQSEGRVYVPLAGAQSYADGINDAGVMSVSGGTEPWALFPCRYDPAVDTQPVCQSSPGLSTGINAAGTVTGWIAQPDLRMFRLGAGGIEILPSVPNAGNALDARGVWIDGDGSVVGTQVGYGGVRYTAARGTEVLGDLLPAGSDWNLASPAFIRSGQIVGWGYHGGHARAFRIKTTPNGDVTAIDTLPMPSTFLEDAPNLMAANGFNGAGEIVGAIWDAAATFPEAAYVYTDAVGARDLNTLIDPASGWTLLAAWGVNDNHEVVGFGMHDGVYRAFKLTLPDLSPCPAPDGCHLPGTRDLLTGVCSYPAKPDGTTCNDGVVCTQSETCQAGTCQGAGTFWTSKPQMATPRFAPAGIAFGGRTYVFGGCDQPPCGNAFTATVEAYDPVQNAWSPRAPMPTARATVSAATIDGTIYVVGGGSQSGAPPWSTTVEAYDPVSDAWMTRASMQSGRASPAIGAIGGKLYVVGGRCCYAPGVPIPPDFVESYDPVTDVWTTRGPVLTGRTEPAYGVIGGKLYMAGGLAADRTLLDTAEAYDPATESWTSLRRMPKALEGPASTVVDGKLYVMGGSTASSGLPFAIFTDVYIYDPASDAWSVGPPMTSPRYDAVATVSGDTILLAGGYTASGPTTVVEALSGLHGPANPYPVVLNLPVDDLGSFGAGSNALEINASGTVVGYATTSDGVRHAWRRTASGPLENLETQQPLSSPTAANAVNDSGTIVGYQTLSDGAHAFRYGAAGVEDLGNIGDGSGAWSWSEFLRGTYPTRINNAGDIVGNYVVSGRVQGFRLIHGLAIEDVGTLVPNGTTLLYAISESGTAVGSSWATAGDASSDRAVLYDSSVAGLVDLNDIVVNPVPGLTLTTADSISGDYIAGWGAPAGTSGKYFAFRLKRSTGWLDVITGGWVSNWAWDVNAAGDIVGAGGMNAEDYAASIGRAFVFTDQLGFKKLDDLIPQASGWTLRGAYSINASGEIVGWGIHSGYAGSRPFHLKLPPGQAASCQARNTCGGGDGDAVCLFSDGVVETSPGRLVAIFGHENAAATSVHPSVNEVRLDGNVIVPVPSQPADLPPGTHTGGFLPRFDSGHTISWTVGSETVTASASSPHLQPVPIGNNGVGVVIGGQTIVLEAPPCTNPPFDDGTPCNDGDACTRTDVCQGGYCVGANPVPCIASDGCHSATCDPTTGQCTETTNVGTCNLGAFEYDKAGRLIRDRGTELSYDAYDQLREVHSTASPPAFTNLSVDDLKTPGDGETQALAGHASSNGHVPVEVSLVGGGYRTLLFEGNGAPVDLTAAAGMGTSVFGNAMNDANAVAGTWTSGGTNHAFRYDQNGFHDLGNPGDFTVAYDINNQNQITGYFSVGGNAHGYRHSDATGFEEIPTFGGAQSWGWRVDDLGTVAASAQTPNSPSTGFARFGHAALYQDIVGLQDLDAQYGDPLSGRTLAIANERQGEWVVGIATQGAQTRAYRLKLSTGAIDDIGWAGSSFGYSVNSAGDAVGWGYFDAGETIQAAWILSERTGFARLNDLIDPASGWDLRTAGSIDDFGGVVGWGYHNGLVSVYRLRIPAHSSGSGGPAVAEVHTYGYDGLRTSTTTAPGTTNANTQFWFTQDYSEHDGNREHYVRVGNRIVAKVTLRPPPGGGGMGVLIDQRRPSINGEELVAKTLLALLLAGGLAATGAGLIGKKRRPAWVAVTAGPVILFFLASCEQLNTNRRSAATVWERIETVYFHAGLAAGPVLTTNANGTLREERRSEPFGQPVDANVGGTLGPVDFRREQQNSLGKLTNPNTGWSYHGARWMQPQTARWTAPDPLTKLAPDRFPSRPWELNPYAYVNWNPIVLWDPDGESPRIIIVTDLPPSQLSSAQLRVITDRVQRGMNSLDPHTSVLLASPTELAHPPTGTEDYSVVLLNNPTANPTVTQQTRQMITRRLGNAGVAQQIVNSLQGGSFGATPPFATGIHESYVQLQTIRASGQNHSDTDFRIHTAIANTALHEIGHQILQAARAALRILGLTPDGHWPSGLLRQGYKPDPNLGWGPADPYLRNEVETNDSLSEPTEASPDPRAF